MQNYKVPMISQIEEMVSDIPGWTPIDQLYTLFLLSYSIDSSIKGNIIEIGSWCGRSSVVLGTAVKLSNVGKMICVDLFPDKSDWYENLDGTYSFKVKIGDKVYGGYESQTAWTEPFKNSILPVYEKNESLISIFNDSIKRNKLNDIIIPYKGDSSILSNKLNKDFKCKFAFIDGDHSYEAVVKDIYNVEKYLIPGAWVCFDDAFSSYEGVNEAIQEKIINSGLYENCQQLTRKLFAARRI